LYSKPAPRGVTAVGFKTKLKDVSALDEFASTLINHEVRILTLLRENRVKLAISTLNARRIHAMHGRWNLTTGQAPLPPLDACVDDIVAMIERVDAAQHEVSKFATSLPLPRLEVTYEALLTSHASSMTQIQEFLQVVPRSLMGDVAKATVDDLRRSVVHLDELAARLQHANSRAASEANSQRGANRRCKRLPPRASNQCSNALEHFVTRIIAIGLCETVENICVEPREKSSPCALVAPFTMCTMHAGFGMLAIALP
jgi:hypothetical protein